MLYTHRTLSSKIETLNGHFADPLNMDPDDLRIGDIAHALAHTCRFSGYTSRHYSVAEHSVYVARIVATRLATETLYPAWAEREIIRQALLHDATEAYLIDMPSPIKRAFPEYRAAEKRLWEVIAKKFDVPVEMHPFVKDADGRICTTEKLALLGPVTTEEEWGQFMRDFPPYTGAEDIIDRYAVQPAQARRRFLDMFDQVKP